MATVAKDLEVTLAHIVLTTGVLAGFILGHIPWMMDLNDPAGEEKMQAGILNKPMTTWTQGRKRTGSLARSKREEYKLKRLLA